MNDQNETPAASPAEKSAPLENEAANHLIKHRYAACGNCFERIEISDDTATNYARFEAHKAVCPKTAQAREQLPQLLRELMEERRKAEEENQTMSTSRTDKNNNPAAFTVDIAKQAGLIEGTDYVAGDPFPQPSKLVTARLLGDPRPITIKVIDKIGYYTADGKPRWDYIAVPKFLWNRLTIAEKTQVIAFHYHREGGTALLPLFTPHLEF